MPDGWEYPWFAAWDLAFHMLPMALVDPDFAKDQLLLLTREWYQHPNGQLPAYEWTFSDVNPPVHAWAALARLQDRPAGHRQAGPRLPRADLPEAAPQLHVVGQPQGRARATTSSRAASSGSTTSACSTGPRRCPVAGHLGQADGTAWMGFYSLSMLAIALELARDDAVYEDVATKFFEHFLYIAGALNGVGIESASRCGTTRTSSSTTCSISTPASSSRSRSARWSGSSRSWPSRPSSPSSSSRCPAFKRRHGLVPAQPARPRRARPVVGGARASASGGCWRSSAATG